MEASNPKESPRKSVRVATSRTDFQRHDLPGPKSSDRSLQKVGDL